MLQDDHIKSSEAREVTVGKHPESQTLEQDLGELTYHLPLRREARMNQ